MVERACLLQYAKDTQPAAYSFRDGTPTEHIIMDARRRNLEVPKSTAGGGVKEIPSPRCLTLYRDAPMGSQMLKRCAYAGYKYILRERQRTILGALLQDTVSELQPARLLRQVGDLERILARVWRAAHRASARSRPNASRLPATAGIARWQETWKRRAGTGVA